MILVAPALTNSTTPPRVYISYRKDDTGNTIGRLVDHLQRTLAPNQVFVDTEHISFGSDWKACLWSELLHCSVFLVVIGPAWTNLQDENGQQRFLAPEDWTRFEVEVALLRSRAELLTVAPILVGSARLPKQADLPSNISSIIHSQARILRTEPASAWQQDADELSRWLIEEQGFTPKDDQQRAAVYAIRTTDVWSPIKNQPKNHNNTTGPRLISDGIYAGLRADTFVIATALLFAARPGASATEKVYAGVGMIVALGVVMAMRHIESVIPSMISKRRVANIAWILLWMTLLYASSNGNPSTLLAIADSPNQSLAFLLVGGVLGAVIRHCFGATAFSTVLGRAATTESVGVICVWGLILLLYPLRSTHAPSGLAYTTGVVLGALAHKGNRAWKRDRARKQRRIGNVFQMWNGGGLSIHDRQRSLRLLSSRWGHGATLRWLSKLEDSRSLKTPHRIVRSSYYRLEGEYEKSNSDTKHATIPPNTPEDLHLLLIRSLNLSELHRDDESDELLDAISNSHLGSRCSAVQATKALRLAEHAISNGDDADYKPLDTINDALKLRGKYCGFGSGGELGGIPEFTSLGVPVTPTFIKDVIGTCLLAAGLFAEAKIYLESCIRDDPSYSSAYMHLGDYYYMAGTTGELRPRSGHTPTWHAAACYECAKLLETGLKSRVRKRASDRLTQLRQLKS